MFIETHAHLNDKVFDADRADVIGRAFKSGVAKIIEIACGAKEWQPAEALCVTLIREADDGGDLQDRLGGDAVHVRPRIRRAFRRDDAEREVK